VSDNRSKFRNTRIDELCDDMGIKHEFSAKYTPESNGLVERKNTLIDMARSMLSEYNMIDAFWVEAIKTACHVTTIYIVAVSWRRPPMSCLLEERPILLTLDCLVANAIFSRRALSVEQV